MQTLAQNLLNGIAAGSIYALIALGYTMVYGILKLINFAHGDVFMLGSFFGYYGAKWWAAGTHQTGAPRPSWIMAAVILLGSMVACGLFGFINERVAYRPLRNAPRIASLITIDKHLINYGGMTTTNYQLIVLVVALIFMVMLQYIVYGTKFGRAMRAVSFNLETASLMGIPTDRIVSMTFVIGSVLAAVAGILYGLAYPKIDPLMGIMPGIKAFAAAVLGGIGNIPGAVIGGLLIGVIEAFVGGSQFSSYRDAIAFVVMVLILLFRPAGLLGKSQAEKV